MTTDTALLTNSMTQEDPFNEDKVRWGFNEVKFVLARSIPAPNPMREYQGLCCEFRLRNVFHFYILYIGYNAEADQT